MAINFPSSPINGQQLVTGTSTYTYNLAKATWDLSVTAVVGPTGPTGPAGSAGYIGADGRFTIADTTGPTSPILGNTWFNSATGKTYVYYDSYWVQIESAGPNGATGPAGAYVTQATAPGAPTTGQAWMNTTDGRLYIYNGTAWFEPTNNQSGPTGPTGPAGLAGTSPSAGKIIAMALVFGG